MFFTAAVALDAAIAYHVFAGRGHKAAAQAEPASGESIGKLEKVLAELNLWRYTII